MYQCSDAFHAAVANGNEQMAMLIFDDCLFTDKDINVTEGIRFQDHFNTDEDLSIGQANSNEISFSLFNDDRLLNDYTFGDFLATVGVVLGESTYIMTGNCSIETANATWVGRNNSPRLTRNGSAVNVQPAFAVKSLMGYNGKVWAFGGDGQYAIYTDAGVNVTGQYDVNAFMRNKSTEWSGKGMYYNKDTRKLYIRQSGRQTEYEFVPFGWFTAERPKAPDVIEIHLTCYDFMQKLDADMPSDADAGITYPITFLGLMQKIAQYAGVQCSGAAFINSTATLNKRPDEFDSSTMRDVIKWIAEAAGSNARFNRDGVLEMTWLRNTTQSYAENAYMEFNPAWYETKKISKLWNRDTQTSSDKTVGDGDEGYLIQDNPLLRGVV